MSKYLPKLRTRARTGRRGRFAFEPIRQDAVIIEFQDEELVDSRTRRSLQLDEGKHLCGRLASFGLANHSCDPNSWVDVEEKCARALRDISEGEETPFNYLTTEYEMHSGFHCKCGSSVCYETIRGFKHLNREQQLALEPYLTPYLPGILRPGRERKPASPAN
jgi:SET domain-containing protein